MSVNYKILCEIKLLHEFYLTDKNGSTVFDIPVQQDRINFLRERFTFNFPSVNGDLAYEPADFQQKMFENNKLRVIQTYSGFKLFTSVNEKLLPGDILGYVPAMNITNDQSIFILLKKKNSFLDSLSNSSLSRSLHSWYYFTNRNLGTPQLPPVLSRFPPLRDDTITYEQGELVVDPADNATKAFFFEKNGSGNWLTVPSDGYVNANDSCLVPTNLVYHFSKADAVNDVTFVLTDNNGAIAKTLTQTSPTSFGNISLNYSDVVTSILSADKETLPLPFTLDVTATNGFHKIHSILFTSPEMLQPNTWGIIHLQPKVTDPSYNLLDNDGLLITRKNPDGTVVPAPIFEIRIKSRFSFWRYFNNKNQKIKDNAALHPFLDYDATRGIMEMKKMLNASYTPIEFTNMGSTQYLPNPDADNPLSTEVKRIYNDIRVPESDLFKKL